MLDGFIGFTQALSQWMIPLVILGIVLAARWRGVLMYESFITGAKEGFNVVIMIIPYLVAILFVIKVFLASGLFEDVRWVAAKGLGTIGLEQAAESLELLPLALTRPLSGGAAQGVFVDLIQKPPAGRFGPDSYIGNTASLMMGSTETTFYVLSVYFGAIGIKRFRHTLPACLIADAAGMCSALFFGWLLFT
ncbi:spore maturation protein [Botrimarina hoheduenensis]|uniref:Spore maturation protein B n=1 Tax=Botrimarina hoheduenensis TaxID=2528000 RepID=A0A5C5WFG6_9BACT|nr:spore maturation protein [Botrimarina hoheduenensis]TWT48825.1 Spore maturation protein B [Botrimarina hoheduenensis]